MSSFCSAKTLCRTIPAMLVFAALVAAVLPAAADTVLFQDNFNAAALSVDANVDHAARQSGTVGPVSYIGYLGPNPNDPSQTDWQNLFKGDVNTGYVYLGNPDLPLEGSEGTMAMTGIWSVFPWPMAVLDKNWNNGLSAGGMKIGFDVYSAGPYELDVVIAGNSALTCGVVISPTDPPRFGVRLKNTGLWDAYVDDVSGIVATGDMGTTLGDAWHHFDFVCSDPTDAGYDGTTNFGNPFDGVGTTRIDMYLDGASTPFGTYTKGDGGYANNYVGIGTLTHDYVGQTAYTMGDGHYTYFDNLTVSQVPEPNTLVLLALAGLGLAWFRLRK